MFQNAAKSIISESQKLSELDMIGDADFGVNISTGFEKILVKLSTLNDPDIGTTLTSAGQVLLFDVGSTIGGLIGRAFQKAGQQLMSKRQMSCQELVVMLQTFLTTIQKIGGAKAGDKTIVDALEPAANAAEAASKSGIASVRRILEISASAAKEGANNTVNMVAKIGRASYIGERSRGTVDPGAWFIYLFLQAMSQSYDL
jgi:dihydroxyacetone kinase-like protein